jgi:V/A-type H+-transporting ATPase subunit A
VTGRILGISGPTVSVDLRGLKLYERVYVGRAMLTGEVVRLDQERAVIQVYEDTRGLAIGEPVKGVGMPLTVRLSAGLLSGMFDGLQRPLERMRDEMGPFIRGSTEIAAVDYLKKWRFHPLRNKGEEIGPGEEVGYLEEGPFRHYVMNKTSGRQKVSWLADGEVSMNDFLGRFESGGEILGCMEWPVRAARPYRKKYAPSMPLVTGQRGIDFLFPLAKGGTAILPGGFGTGKTILEQAMAKFADVDIVVYVGCGERGNEMAEMIEEFLILKDPWTDRPLTDRTILVVNTSNMPVAAREASIYTAVTMAEYYRDMGYHVLFLADSLSRWAEALREISSSLEEMPGEEGYPTYLSGFHRSSAGRCCGASSAARPAHSARCSRSASGRRLHRPRPGMPDLQVIPHARHVLAHRRHFPAINWFQATHLKDLRPFEKQYSPEWIECSTAQGILRKEESCAVAEILGFEAGMLMLLMHG